MKSVSLLLALIESVVGLGGIVLLITTIASDADPIKALAACVLFMVGSVLAASSWVKGLGVEIAPDVKYTKI